MESWNVGKRLCSTALASVISLSFSELLSFQSLGSSSSYFLLPFGNHQGRLRILHVVPLSFLSTVLLMLFLILLFLLLHFQSNILRPGVSLTVHFLHQPLVTHFFSFSYHFSISISYFLYLLRVEFISLSFSLQE